MKEYVHSEKFKDVDDLEVSDEDGDTPPQQDDQRKQ